MQVFTLGYQGATLETYIGTLKSAGIDLVVDVRETAWSYKPGFSKTALSTALQSAGINYLHLRSAGNPSENRKTAKSSKECLARYKKHLRSNRGCLDELGQLITQHSKKKERVCLTCFERHPEECHRSVLLKELQKQILRMGTIHLLLSEQPATFPLRVP